MPNKNTCVATIHARTLQVNAIRLLAVFLLFICIIAPKSSFAQEQPEYDEVSVFFSVPRIGGADLSAVVRDEVLYLSVTEVFSFLKIKNTFTPGFNTISGFFVNEQDEFLID